MPKQHGIEQEPWYLYALSYGQNKPASFRTVLYGCIDTTPRTMVVEKKRDFSYGNCGSLLAPMSPSGTIVFCGTVPAGASISGFVLCRTQARCRGLYYNRPEKCSYLSYSGLILTNSGIIYMHPRFVATSHYDIDASRSILLSAS